MTTQYLKFPNLAVFRAAFGTVPATTLSEPVAVYHDNTDHNTPLFMDSPTYCVENGPKPPAGATLVKRVPASLLYRDCSCWAEALPVTQTGTVPESVGMAMFLLPDEDAAMDMAGEMVRLGCDRQEMAVLPKEHNKGVMLRVSGPPYYSVLRVLDGSSTKTRAFIPSGSVWVEVGCTHPLSLFVKPPVADSGKKLVLIPRDTNSPWFRLPDGPWTALNTQVDVELVPAQNEATKPASKPQRRLSVPLRLGRSINKQPCFWINTDPDAVDKLIQDLPEAISSQLDLCVLADTGVTLFRTRIGSRNTSGMSPELPGQAFTNLSGIPGMYVPVGQAIEPPMRIERLQQLLNVPRDSEGWVQMDPATGKLSVHYVPSENFVRLDEWVDYLMDRDADILNSWVASASFQFDGLKIIQNVQHDPTDGTGPRTPRGGGGGGRASGPRDPVAIPAPNPQAVVRPPVQAIRVDLTPDAAALAVANSERAFLALDSNGDDQIHTEMWAELGGLYARADRTREAGLAWGRAAWSGQADMVTAFHTAMQNQNGPVARILTNQTPNREQVRTVAAAIISNNLPVTDSVRTYIQTHGAVLDLRTWWMTEQALSRDSQTGQVDRVAMARARDRMFTELQHGLPVSRELPAFLRFSGVGSAAHLGEPLEKIRNQFMTVKRNKHQLEAAPALTGAYTDLVFAWGFARLGIVDRAVELRDAALAAVPQGDAIHGFCSAGLAARIQQALDGEPVQVPLPANIVAMMQALTKFDQYKINRFRQACRILEPQETLDPILQYADTNVNPWDATFRNLRGMTDGEQLSLALQGLVTTHNTNIQVLDGVLNFIPVLSGTLLVSCLDGVIAQINQLTDAAQIVPLATKALCVASQARAETQGVAMCNLVTRTMPQLPNGASNPLVAQHLSNVLGSFRRMGRTEETRPLLDALMATATADIPARLGLAAGLLAVSREADAQPMLDAGWARLNQKPPLPERMQISRGLAAAQAFTTPEVAVTVLNRLFPMVEHVTDSYNTNSHYAISLIEYAEILVQSVCHEELSLGDKGRRIVEEDEYLLRQRVHRDMVG